MRRVGVLAAVAVLGLLAGCSASGSPRAAAARQTAEAFSAAVAADPAGACGLLAPQTRQELEDSDGPCPEAITGADLPQSGHVVDVEVYGLDAVVRLEHDTMFLALFDAGWRVTAAGCTPQEPSRPYSCDVKGA